MNESMYEYSQLFTNTLKVFNVQKSYIKVKSHYKYANTCTLSQPLATYITDVNKCS